MTTLLHVFTNVIEIWFDNIDTYAKKSLLYNDFHVNVRQCPTYKQQFINNAHVLRCTNAHYLSQPMFFTPKLHFLVVCNLITIALNALDER